MSSGRVLMLSEEIQQATQVVLFDHFAAVDSKSRWTARENDDNATISVPVTQTAGNTGYITLSATTDANEECYLISNDLFEFVRGRPFYIQARMFANQTATNPGAFFIGCAGGLNANAAAPDNTIADGGLDLKSTFTGAGFFKPYLSSRWSAVTSTASNTSKTTTPTDVSLSTGAGATGAITFGILCEGVATTGMQVSYWADSGGGANLQHVFRELDQKRVKHMVNWDASSTRLALIAGVKNVAGAATCQLHLDYFGVATQAYRADT